MSKTNEQTQGDGAVRSTELLEDVPTFRLKSWDLPNGMVREMTEVVFPHESFAIVTETQGSLLPLRGRESPRRRAVSALRKRLLQLR